MSQAKFEGSGARPPLEHLPGVVPRAPARTALSVLRDLGGERPALRWRHWIVGVEPIGRVTLPVEARAVLDADGAGVVRVLCRDLTLVLRGGGAGASLTVDGRGRLFLPAWLRRATLPTLRGSDARRVRWYEAYEVRVVSVMRAYGSEARQEDRRR